MLWGTILRIFATYGILIFAELWDVIEEQLERRLEDEIVIRMPAAWEKRLSLIHI